MSALAPSRSPTLTEVLRAALAGLQAQIHTSLPAEVVAYDANAQTVDCQPWIKLPRYNSAGELVFERPPLIVAVPVVFQGGGGFRATYPIAQGDTVLLNFCEASIGAWLAAGSEVDPEALHRHHFTDAVAHPGAHSSKQPWTGAATDAATWGKDGGPQVVVRAGSVELGGTAADPAGEHLVKGDTYRAAEDTMLTAVSTSLSGTAGAVAAAAASLGVAAPLNAIPVVGGILALAPLLATVASLATVSGLIAPGVTAIATFQAAAATYLSTIGKTK